MKKFLLLLLCATSALCISAQNYVSTPDVIWGCRYFAYDYNSEFPYSNGNKNGTTAASWPTQNKIGMCYYARIPVSHVKATLVYNPRVNRALNLDVVITNQATKQVVYEGVITTDRAFAGGEMQTELFPDINFTSDAWYQIKLYPHDDSYYSAPSRVISLQFYRESGKAEIVTNAVFMAPSAHNNTWGSTQPNAVNENTYDWVYGEFLYPEEYVLPARYLMCLGGSGYYSGIQSTNGTGNYAALFSAWDNGDTDKDPNLPAYLRSMAIDRGSNTAINRFGGEGTGVQSMLNPAHWRPGHWVQWLLNARPETATVLLENGDGSTTELTYINTILSAWYKMDYEDDWYYISTIRQSGTSHLFGNAGEYSFLECYGEKGGDLYARCYMKNRFYRSAGSGVWYNRNYMTGGHYNYNDGARECRYDYGHGATSLYENCFYIEHGGFGEVNDSSDYVPLLVNTECVDTIDIDAKQARINEAFRNNNYSTTLEDLNAASAKGDEAILAYAKDLIDNAGKVGSYGREHLSAIIEAYNEGNPSDIGALTEAIKQTAQQYNKLRFANVTNKQHIGSQRSYLLDNTEGYGLLYVDNSDGTPTLRTGDLDREDPRANWMVVRSDKYGTLNVYNIGTGYYIDTEADNLLSTNPQNIAAFARSGKGFYIGNNTSICVVANEDGSTYVDRFTTTGGQYLLHDNLSLTPQTALVQQVVEAGNKPGKFEEYKAMVPGILATPEGVVGYWTDSDQLEQLRTLYDDGNITYEKADELISLIDNADKITIDMNNLGAYTILSAAEVNTATPALSIDDDGYLSHKSATGKAEQVWIGIPKRGGLELSAQGKSINTLSDKSNVNITTKTEGEGAPMFFTPLSAGLYSISTVQYGPTAMGSNDAQIKTANSGTAGTEWYIKPAETVKVSLNSAGIQSLYLDIDVKIPDDVEVYTLVGFHNGNVQLAPVSDIIPARTPVIIKGDSYAAPLFTIVPSQTYPEEEGLLKGTLLKKTGLKSKTFYTVSVKSGQPCIAQALTNSVSTNQCYILQEDMDALGLTETQYNIDFDNITAVDDIKAAESETAPGVYDLQGRPADEQTKGIVIESGKTVLKK